MQFKNVDVFIKILLVALLAFLSGCSRKETSSNRRLPKDNANNLDYNFTDSDDDFKVKRVDDYYDAYQKYQSNEAPVSLKDLKKVRRRPVLNIQELNDIMDNNYNKSHVKNSHKNTEDEQHHDLQTPCTESDCDIDKTIQYNKRKAKKYKLKAKNKSSQIIKNKKTEDSQPTLNTNKTDTQTKNNIATSTPITIKTEPSQPTTDKAPIPPTAKPIENSASSQPAAQLDKTTQNSQDSAGITQKALPTDTIAKPNLPPIALPEANVVKPLPAQQQQVQTPTQITTTTAPIINKPIPATDNNINAESAKSPLNITSQKSTNIPVAVSKLNKYTQETKLETINILLVKYIYTLKNKIANIFNRD